jgi:hypothetical protein
MIFIGMLLIAGAVLFGMGAAGACRDCKNNTPGYIDALEALAASTALATTCAFGGLLLLLKGVMG